MDVDTDILTAEDLFRMPDDGFRYELLHGRIRKFSPSGFEHGKIAAAVTRSLAEYVSDNKLGAVCAAETGFKLAMRPDHVRAPDVAFIRRDRVEQAGTVVGFWPGAPDLAVEVVSPSDSYTEVEDKVFDWLEAGTSMVIVINPRKRTATVYRSLTQITAFSEAQTLDGADVIPGWSLRVGDLFAS